MKIRLLIIIIGIMAASSILFFALNSTNDSHIIPIELKVAQKILGPSAWHFSGTVMDSETEIKMSVRSPDGNIITTDIIIPSENGNFDTIINTDGPLWANAGKYLLILEQGEFKEIQTFEILEDDDFDETYGGPGNRHPAFLGYYIPDICTGDMVKFLKKNSNMFDNDIPYSHLDGPTDIGINPDDFVQCENELLENRDNEPSWSGK